MDAESIKSALQAKNGVVMDFKLEWDAFRFLLFDKMFAMLGFDKQQEPILTLKLPPQEGAWYLVAEHNGQPAVFRLDDIQVVQPTAETFRWNEQLYRLSENPGFVQALPHFRCIRQSLDVLSSP